MRSYIPIDDAEHVEFSARQRTFEQAYARTALLNLAYGALILKVFNGSFYRGALSLWFVSSSSSHQSCDVHLAGLLFGILALFLFAVSIVRSMHSKQAISSREPLATAHTSHANDRAKIILMTPGQSTARNFGKPFVTAGWIVVAVTIGVAAIEISMIIVVSQIT